MKLTYTYHPSPLLREKSKPIPENEYPKWFKVGETMKAMLGVKSGVGLAGNQAGLDKQIAIIAFPDKDGEHTVLKTILNPEIIFMSPETIKSEEGCLSYPELYVDVERPSEVIVRGVLEGEGKTTIRARGFFARIFCHEIGHLNAKAFFDNLNPIENEMIQPILRKIESSNYNDNAEEFESCE